MITKKGFSGLEKPSSEFRSEFMSDTKAVFKTIGIGNWCRSDSSHPSRIDSPLSFVVFRSTKLSAFLITVIPSFVHSAISFSPHLDSPPPLDCHYIPLSFTRTRTNNNNLILWPRLFNFRSYHLFSQDSHRHLIRTTTS